MSTSAQPPAMIHGDTDSVPEPSSSGRRALVMWTCVLVAVVLAADQLTKWWAESSLTVGGDSIQILGELLSLRLIYNSGAALSIGSGLTWLVTVVVVIAVLLMSAVVWRVRSRGWAVAMGLVLGGALGNLVDRLVREPGFGRGHVVDFIDYAGFFVGNVADIAVVAGAVLIVLLTLQGIHLDGTRDTVVESDVKPSDDEEETV